MKDVEVENQAPVSKGETRGIHGAAGAAEGTNLQKTSVTLGSGGWEVGLFLPLAACLHQQIFFSFCSLSFPPSAENGASAALSLPFWNLESCNLCKRHSCNWLLSVWLVPARDQGLMRERGSLTALSRKWNFWRAQSIKDLRSA